MKNLIFTLSLILLTTTSANAARSKDERRALFTEANQRLAASKIGDKAPKVGELFPNVTIGATTMKDLTKNGPVVLTFYRGGWCPYCVTQLKGLEKRLGELKSLNAQLVAISPETAMEVKKTKEKQGLSMIMVSDKDNQLARQLNLVFTVEKEVAEEYLGLGIDLKKSQGNDRFELPIPATFVIGKDQRVKFAYVNPEYTQRAKEEDILGALK